MATVYRVDTHPKKNAIIRDLINQVPYQTIVDNYGLSYGSVQRYASKQLRMHAAKALAKNQYDGVALLSRIEDTIVYVQKMYDACNDWLEDPDDHSKYNLDPRAYEHQVIYNKIIPGDDKDIRIRKKDSLQELLDRAIKDDEEVIKVESKVADPRNIVLQTATTLNKQLETLAKIVGVVQEVTNVDVNISFNKQIVSNVIKIIETEVADNPELMQRLIQGIANEAK